MFVKIVEKLTALGYEVKTADEWLINHCIDKVNQAIMNDCNIDDIPDALSHVVIERVCGEFLFLKRGMGQLDIDVEPAAKRIKEGDTDVTFAIEEEAITLDGLIAALREYGRSQLVRFRRLVW